MPVPGFFLPLLHLYSDSRFYVEKVKNWAALNTIVFISMYFDFVLFFHRPSHFTALPLWFRFSCRLGKEYAISSILMENATLIPSKVSDSCILKEIEVFRQIAAHACSALTVLNSGRIFFWTRS